VSDAAISPDGKLIAIGASVGDVPVVKVYALKDGTVEPVRMVGIPPDNKLRAVGFRLRLHGDGDGQQNIHRQ
jgi:hypothetical protein